MRYLTPGLLLLSLLATAATASSLSPGVEHAIAAQLELLAASPSDPGLLNDTANLEVLAGRLDVAESHYRHALEIDANNTVTRFNLALLLRQTERPEEALVELQRVVSLDPRHAWAHYQLGVILEGQGSKKKAVEQYARAFALDPQLSFAEVNPQVLGSKLYHEALLRSYDLQPPQVMTPRIYSDPNRVATLLLNLPSPPAEATGGEPKEPQEPAEPEAAPPPPSGSRKG